MKLVIEIFSQLDEHVTHRVFEKFPVTVGRGYQNDIILTDPHVSAQHLRIDGVDGRWTATDLDSENGTEIGGILRIGGSATVKSGDTVRLGAAELRFYHPHHPVNAATPMEKVHSVSSALAKPVVAWGIFALALLVLQAWAYLEVWSDEQNIVQAATAGAVTFTVIIWASLWSVAGRLIRHRSHFSRHVAVMSLYLMAGAFAWYIESFADFLTNQNWVSDIVAYGMNGILLGCLLYASLRLASRMTAKRRLFSATVLGISIMAGMFALRIINEGTFSQQPLYPATLEPWLAEFAPAETVDQFMQSSEKSFADKEFSAAENSLNQR